MTQIVPPPTHESPINTDPVTGIISFSPQWLKWFLDLAAFMSASGGASGGTVHSALSELQGGGTGEYYHLTAADHTTLTGGFTGTGPIVRQTSPSLVTPALGAATATSVTASGGLTAGQATALIHASTALNNGAAAAGGTLTNAPAAGNPTKWIPVDDAGVTRYVPAW